MSISKKILQQFNISGIGEPLAGGQGTSIKYDDIVLKPVNDENEYTFVAEILERLYSEEYRLVKSIRSNNNNFIEGGYGATRFEPGSHDENRIEDVFRISKQLHSDLKEISSVDYPFFNNPWARSSDILWRSQSLPKDWDDEKYSFITNILKELPKIYSPHQIIHGDIAGNILFHETLPPLIIDFSPHYAPYEFANAIIVADSIAWGGKGFEILKYLKPLESYLSFLKYAVVFRVLTVALMENYSSERMHEEWEAYQKVWEFCI